MADRRDWFFKQLVLQSEMDDEGGEFEREFSRHLARLSGIKKMGTLGTGDKIEAVLAGSIFSGGTLGPNTLAANKQIFGVYLVAAVPSEVSPDTPLKVHDDSTKDAPIVATHGTPNSGPLAVGSSEWLYDFTTDIAGIGAGNEANFRVYAKLARTLSDPRTDGNGATVNFKRAVAMVIQVDKSEGVAPWTTLPAIRTDGSVHLGVVGPLTNATTAITSSLIANRDRLYNGYTSFGLDRRMVQVLSMEDSLTGVTTGTKGERVITLSPAHSRAYVDIDPVPNMDQTVGGKRAIWAYEAVDGTGASNTTQRCGRFRDVLIAVMEIWAQAADNDVVAGVGIAPLGMTDTADAVGLTANDLKWRYRFHNNSGGTISINAICYVYIYDVRSGLFLI